MVAVETASVCPVALFGQKSPENGFRLRTVKHRAVLAALLLDSAPVERMELALRFWPDQADPLNHLRQAVADIRRACGGDALLAEGKTLRLRARARFRTDVDDLQELLAEARATPDSAERLGEQLLEVVDVRPEPRASAEPEGLSFGEQGVA
ncbi:MAG: hypothetical protein EOO74_11695, partial [Myxococcales bacterium]